MEKEFNFQNIEDYVNGKLKGEAKKSFEADMATDNELAKEVEFYQDLSKVSEVIGDENLKSIIGEIDSELENEDFFIKGDTTSESSNNENTPAVKKEAKIRQIGIRKLMSLVASILILISIGTWWWANANYADEALASHYFNQEITQPISRSKGGNTMDNFEPGLESLKSGNYTEAIRFFSNIPDSDEAYSEARLYLAIAQFKTQDYQNAIANAKLVSQRNSRFSEKAQWIQINAMLGFGQTGAEFENLLNDMAANSPDKYYRNEATRLKKDLDRFWRKFVF